MARPSPATQRVLATLNFFAEHPGSAFSLTDLIQALRMNRATCHALLAELVEGGYLYRNNDKQYVLGPAVARIGRAAEAQLSPLQIALPEMRVLADRHDAICSAVFRERDDVVIRERVASGSHLGDLPPRGTRLPLRPPFGASFLAWADPEAGEAWLNGLCPPPSPSERQRTRDGMLFAREQGFQYATRSTPEAAVETSADWLFIEDPAARPVQIGIELVADKSYRLASMSSPVLDRKSRVAFVLSLTGFTNLYTGAEIRSIGSDLHAACLRITSVVTEL